MRLTPEYIGGMIGAGTGFVSGSLFSLLVGTFDSARYIIEQTTLIPFEALFVTIAAMVSRKYGVIAGAMYALFGVFGSIAIRYPEISITSAVFLKTALCGLLIIYSGRLFKTFSMQLTSVSSIGIMMAAVIGFQVVYTGVSPETLSEIRQEAMDMYLAFMSPGDATNSADNAMELIRRMFDIGFAILAVGAVVTSWISCLITGWLARRSGDAFLSVPPFSRFTLPFPVIWVFLASFAIVLTEIPTIYPVALNLLVFTACLYGAQGIAVVAFHMNRASLGRFPRVLFWLVFFITLAFSGIIFVFTGILDNWFHLRSVPSAPGAEGGKEGIDHEGDSSRRR